MKWLIAGLIVLALSVIYLFQRNLEIERAAKPGIRLIAATL